MSESTNRADGSPASKSGGTSSSLLRRVKSNDAAAWKRFVDVYGPSVYRWCRDSGLQGADAADVAQEVFAVVFTKIADFRRDRPGDSFRAWLKTITLNKVRDRFRRMRREPDGAGGSDAREHLAQVAASQPSESPSSASQPGEPVLESRAMELVRAGVEDRTWRAFWQVTVRGQRAADVADELGMSVAAVYKAKYRVIRLIRDQLSDLEA